MAKVGVKKDRDVVLNDVHFPYHDPRALGLVIDFIRDNKPGRIHLNGDIFDFYSLSKFDKNPERRSKLQKEIDAGVQFFQQLREASPDSQIEFNEGNHELRLQKYLWGKADELAGLQALRFEDLCHLNEYKIRFHPVLKPYKIGKLLFFHGNRVSKHAGSTARAHYEQFGCNVIVGHCHRLGSYYHATYDDLFGAWENGCLCKLNPEYLLKPDWQQAFSIIWYHGSRFTVEPVPIVKHQYVYHGQIYGPRRCNGRKLRSR